jgi:tetratricopeptide (TPR) repeat protein
VEPYAERNLALAWFEWAASTRDAHALQYAAARLSRLDSVHNDAQVLSAKASVALQRSAPQEAIEAYNRVLKLQPQDADTHLRLGRAEQAAGHRDTALKHYGDAIGLDPLLFDAYVLAAQLHRAGGDWTAYRETLERYLQHVPQSLAARQALIAAGR